jgi:hypothetical protein
MELANPNFVGHYRNPMLLHVGLHIRLLQISFLHIGLLHIRFLHIGLLHIRSLHIGLLHIGLLQYRVIAISGFCHIGFLFNIARIFVILGYCISGLLHTGFLHVRFLFMMARVFVYRVFDHRVIEIGF